MPISSAVTVSKPGQNTLLHWQIGFKLLKNYLKARLNARALGGAQLAPSPFLTFLLDHSSFSLSFKLCLRKRPNRPLLVATNSDVAVALIGHLQVHPPEQPSATPCAAAVVDPPIFNPNFWDILSCIPSEERRLRLFSSSFTGLARA